MKKIEFVVEKTATGFSAYAENFEQTPVGTTGATMSELKNNLIDAVNLHHEFTEKQQITEDDLTIRLDIRQFFEFYNEINATALGKRTGLNKTLISQYVNGHKKPSEKQVHKIMEGIRQLGKELSSLEIAVLN